MSQTALTSLIHPVGRFLSHHGQPSGYSTKFVNLPHATRSRTYTRLLACLRLSGAHVDRVSSDHVPIAMSTCKPEGLSKIELGGYRSWYFPTLTCPSSDAFIHQSVTDAPPGESGYYCRTIESYHGAHLELIVIPVKPTFRSYEHCCPRRGRRSYLYDCSRA